MLFPLGLFVQAFGNLFSHRLISPRCDGLALVRFDLLIVRFDRKLVGMYFGFFGMAVSTAYFLPFDALSSRKLLTSVVLPAPT